MASTPPKKFSIINLLKIHYNHSFHINHDSVKMIIIQGSHVLQQRMEKSF